VNEFAQVCFIDETAVACLNLILVLKFVELHTHYIPKMKTKAFAEIQI